jgi:plastocyanin
VQDKSKADKDENQDQPAVSLDSTSEDKPTVAGHIPNLAPTRSSGSDNRNMVLVGLLILIALVAISSYFAFRTKPKTTNTNVTTATVAPAKIAPAAVSISSSGFSPATISTKVGQAVVWTNSDTTTHLVASTNPKPVFSSQQALAKDDSYSYVFSKAGTYPYHDTSNPTLKGEVIVR